MGGSTNGLTMSDPSNDERIRRRRGVAWTAVLLGVLAFGIYIAFIAIMGFSN